MKAISAARLRNGAKQSLTAGTNRRTGETTWNGERPTKRRMRWLPSVARFRLMRPPATLSRVATQDGLTGLRTNQRAFLFPPQMRQAVCPPTGIWTATQPVQYNLPDAQLDVEGPDAGMSRHGWDCFNMTASGRPPNQLLQMPGAADFDLLRPHFVTVELVRETVLGEADLALRHAMSGALELFSLDRVRPR